MCRLDYLDICHPDDREASRERFLQNRDGAARKYRLEKRYLRKDGSFFWGELSVSTLKDEKGNTSYVVGMIVDITDRKERERQLMESQEKLKTIYRMANVGFSFTDTAGKYRFVNSWLTDHLGYPENELLDLSSKDITHPDDRKASEEKFRELANGSIDEYRLEKRYVRKDGTHFWADLSVSAIKDEKGEIVNIIGMVTDNSHIKHAESELITAKNQLRATLEAIPDYLFEVGLDGKIHNYFSRYKGRIDTNVSEMIGKNLSDVVSPDAAADCFLALREADQSGFSEGKQVSVWLHDKQSWFELSVSRKSNGEGSERSFVVLARNITGRKRIESNLIESKNRYR
jgi:PAS domain S-box-containing protein